MLSLALHACHRAYVSGVFGEFDWAESNGMEAKWIAINGNCHLLENLSSLAKNICMRGLLTGFCDFIYALCAPFSVPTFIRLYLSARDDFAWQHFFAQEKRIRRSVEGKNRIACIWTIVHGECSKYVWGDHFQMKTQIWFLIAWCTCSKGFLQPLNSHREKILANFKPSTDLQADFETCHLSFWENLACSNPQAQSEGKFGDGIFSTKIITTFQFDVQKIFWIGKADLCKLTHSFPSVSLAH